MLGKLLKYEIQATARTFLPLYVALLLFAIVNRVFIQVNVPAEGIWAIPVNISVAAYFFLIVAIFVLTFIVMIQRFYKNLLSDQGYLMFTLPVQPWKHILTKTITSIIWIALSMIVTFFSLLILSFSSHFFDFLPEMWQDLQQFIREFNFYFGANGYLYMIEFGLAMIIGAIGSIWSIYASISIGHIFSNHKILASFGAYIVLSIIAQAVVTAAITVVSFGPISNLLSGLSQVTLAHIFLIGLLLFSIVSTVAYYLITNYILNKRLNLD